MPIAVEQPTSGKMSSHGEAGHSPRLYVRVRVGSRRVIRVYRSGAAGPEPVPKLAVNTMKSERPASASGFRKTR